MKDKDKAEEQLINDLVGLRRRIDDLETLKTELKLEKEALQQANEEHQETIRYLASMIENSPDAIISTNKEGNIVFFNNGAEVMLGYRQEEILDRCVTVLYESEERAKEVMRIMRECGGTVSAFETLLRTKDGSLFPVLISASILYDNEGHEAGTVGFNKDLRERKELEQKLEALATTDFLTKLYNRAHFNAKLEEEFHRAERYQTPLSLMLLDIDNFKSVNDTYSHQGGDAYLEALAGLVVSSIREVDIAARYGGEELTIILPNTDTEDAMVLAERLRSMVEGFEVPFGGRTIHRTISIGVSTHTAGRMKTLDEFLAAADTALYAAKRGGRNRVALYSEVVDLASS